MRLSSVLSSHSMTVDLILDGAVVSDCSVKRLPIVSYYLIKGSVLVSLGSLLLHISMAGERNSSM